MSSPDPVAGMLWKGRLSSAVHYAPNIEIPKFDPEKLAEHSCVKSICYVDNQEVSLSSLEVLPHTVMVGVPSFL